MNLMAVERDKLTDSCLRAANEKRLTDIESETAQLVVHLRAGGLDLSDDIKRHVDRLEQLIWSIYFRIYHH